LWIKNNKVEKRNPTKGDKLGTPTEISLDKTSEYLTPITSFPTNLMVTYEPYGNDPTY